MAGSSIATPGAAPWITGFFNAAFFARPRAERSLEDLRLAYGILATRWHQAGRRLGARDLPAFHQAFGATRFHARGRIPPDALRQGSATLLGEWFPAAWEDPQRRAYGLAFETVAQRDAFDPSQRLRHGALRELTPPRLAPSEQQWETYPPVPLADTDAALALLAEPARWPDIASATGRFIPVHRGGLEGQTFEILLALHPVPRTLVATRGYVTCTELQLGGAGLTGAFADTAAHIDCVPAGARPRAFIELTTHAGHFMGRGISRLMIFEEGGCGFVRDVGSWDPMPPHLAAGYRAGGRKAQFAFWGPDDDEAGMLVQLGRIGA
jgi:hypothetical protein